MFKSDTLLFRVEMFILLIVYYIYLRTLVFMSKRGVYVIYVCIHVCIYAVIETYRCQKLLASPKIIHI